MDERRTATLRAAVEAFAPPDARVERVIALAAAALDGLSPARGAKLRLFLDLLAVPMRLPLGARRAALRALADAPAVDLRSGCAALKRLILFLAYAESEPGAENPTWARLGYPGPRDDRARPDVAPGAERGARRRDRRRRRGGDRLGRGRRHRGRRVRPRRRAGGGARSRRRLRRDHFDQRELSIRDLYLESGLCASKDLGVAIFAGATLGGGTAVNWCTSFRLPERIAAEWEAQSGIAGLADELEPHYDALEARARARAAERAQPQQRRAGRGCAAPGRARRRHAAQRAHRLRRRLRLLRHGLRVRQETLDRARPPARRWWPAAARSTPARAPSAS